MFSNIVNNNPDPPFLSNEPKRKIIFCERASQSAYNVYLSTCNTITSNIILRVILVVLLVDVLKVKVYIL